MVTRCNSKVTARGRHTLVVTSSCLYTGFHGSTQYLYNNDYSRFACPCWNIVNISNLDNTRVYISMLLSAVNNFIA